PNDTSRSSLRTARRHPSSSLAGEWIEFAKDRRRALGCEFPIASALASPPAARTLRARARTCRQRQKKSEAARAAPLRKICGSGKREYLDHSGIFRHLRECAAKERSVVVAGQSSPASHHGDVLLALRLV